MEEQTKPDWIAASLAGQLDNKAALAVSNVKANDFELKDSESYWATPVVQAKFGGNKKEFDDFYNKQSTRYNQTKADDVSYDNFVASSMPDKLSQRVNRPFISAFRNTPDTDLWGRSQVGEVYSAKTTTPYEKANAKGVRMGDGNFMSVVDFPGAARYAKNEDGSWKRDPKDGSPYLEPFDFRTQEFKSTDESYDTMADWAGIYGLSQPFLKQIPYFVYKNSINFAVNALDSLAEFGRMPLDVADESMPSLKGLTGGIADFQDIMRWKRAPNTEYAKEHFYSVESLLDLGAQAALQLGGMYSISSAAMKLTGSAKTASAGGRLFMLGITAGPLAQTARENGLNEYETALLVGATLAPLYKIAGLSEAVLRGGRPLEFQKTFSGYVADSFGINLSKGKFSPTSVRSYMNGIESAFSGAGANLAKSPLAHSVVGESLEEMLEQSVDVGARTLYNQISPIYGSKNKFNIDWGNEFNLIIQSGAGGAIGGATVYPLMKKFGQAHPDEMATFEDYVTMGEEGKLLDMIGKYEKENRFGDNHDSNRSNASFLKETINTMATVRDRYGLADIIKNNEMRAQETGDFNQYLKMTKIGQDARDMRNNLYAKENEVESLKKTNASPEKIAAAEEQFNKLKLESEALLSGDRVNRYVTEGLFNVMNKPRSEEYSGRNFVRMNLESNSFKDELDSRFNDQVANQAVVDAEASLLNYKSSGISEAGRQKIQSEIAQQRDALRPELEKYTQDILAVKPDYDPSKIFDYSSLKEESDINQSFEGFGPATLQLHDEAFALNDEQKAAVAAGAQIPSLGEAHPAYPIVKQLRDLTMAFDEVTNHKIEQSVIETNPLLYDYQDGKSTLPFESVVAQQEALKGKNPELYTSEIPARTLKSVLARIRQVTQSVPIAEKYKDAVVAPGTKPSDNDEDIKDTLAQLTEYADKFKAMDDLSKSNLENTEVRINEAYFQTLDVKNAMIEGVLVDLSKDGFGDIAKSLQHHIKTLNETIALRDSQKYEAALTDFEDDFYELAKTKKQGILEAISNRGKGGPDADIEWRRSDEYNAIKSKYDYIRGVLSVKSSNLYDALLDTVNVMFENASAPTDEQRMSAIQGVRYAKAGKYDWAPGAKIATNASLSYTSAVNGGPGSGKSSVVSMLMAGIASNLDKKNSKVIVTAYKDEQDSKRKNLKEALQKFYGKTPSFITDISSDLVNILESGEAIQNVNTIIFDEATLLSRDELRRVNQSLIRINNERAKTGADALTIIYTYDQYQNRNTNGKGYQDSMLEKNIFFPETARLKFSFRQLNIPLTVLEEHFRITQDNKFARDKKVNVQYSKDKGAFITSDRDKFEKQFNSLVDKLKEAGELHKLVYITANEQVRPIDSISRDAVKILTSKNAQGREWDYVFVDAGATNYMTSETGIAEIYTAVTRAKQKVFLVHSSDIPVTSTDASVDNFKPLVPKPKAKQELVSLINAVKNEPTRDVTTSASVISSVPENITQFSNDEAEQNAEPPITLGELSEEETKTFYNILDKSIPVKAHLSTFFNSNDSTSLKREMMFKPSVSQQTDYYLTIAKIGSVGYENISSKNTAYNGKYGMFIEGVHNGQRAVIGVLKDADEVIADSGLMNNRDTLTLPINRDVISYAADPYPIVENVKRNLNEPYRDMSTKQMLGNVRQETNSGVSISNVMIAKNAIKGRGPKEIIPPGAPFVILSAAHSQGELNNLVKRGVNPEEGVFNTLQLQSNQVSFEKLIDYVIGGESKKYVKFNGTTHSFDYGNPEFKAIKASFWPNINSKDDTKNNKTFLTVYHEAVEYFKNDAAMQVYFNETKRKQMLTKEKNETLVYDREFNMYFLLDDYILTRPENNFQHKKQADVIERLMDFVIEHPAFENGFYFNPKPSGTTRTDNYMSTDALPSDILNENTSANLWYVNMPQLKINRDLLFSELKRSEATAAAPAEQTGVDEDGQAVQGVEMNVNPMGLSEFKNTHFPTDGQLAMKAFRQFKADVVAAQFILDGPSPKWIDIDTAMKYQRSNYLNEATRNTENAKKESSINVALGKSFNRLLAKEFPAIRYNASNDTYSISSGFKKSGAFSTNEDNDALTDGMSDVVKTYVYNTPLYMKQGNRWVKTEKFFGPREIQMVAPLFHGADSLSEIQDALDNSTSAEAYSLNKQFFRRTPERILKNVGSSITTVDLTADTRYAQLSSFAINPFRVGNIDFQTINQAFELSKLKYTSDSEKLGLAHQTILNNTDPKVLSAATSKENLPGFRAKDWERDNAKIMEELMRESLTQNPETLDILMSTGENNISLGPKGKFMADIMMKLRTELATDENTVANNGVSNIINKHSIYGIKTQGSFNLVDTIVNYIRSIDDYVPGNSSIEGYRFNGIDGEAKSKFTRTSKYPISFKPSVFTDNFINGFVNRIKNQNVTSDVDGATINGNVWKVEKEYSDSTVLNAMREMGLNSYTQKNLDSLKVRYNNVSSNFNSGVMDYFFQVIRGVKQTKSGKFSELSYQMSYVLDSYSADEGLGNSYSSVNLSGDKVYRLRNTSPIMRVSDHIAEIRVKFEKKTDSSPMLNALYQGLLVNPVSGYGVSITAPFINEGVKYIDNYKEKGKRLADMRAHELVESYILDGFVANLTKENPTQQVTFPVTVYSDSNTEPSVIFESKNWMDSPNNIFGKLFESRAVYFQAMADNITESYRKPEYSKYIGQVNSIYDVAASISKIPLPMIMADANMVENVHYVINGNSAGIKPDMIRDVALYTTPANKMVFVNSKLKSMNDFVDILKNDEDFKDINNVSTYDKILKHSGGNGDSYIKAFYANQMLMSNEFQKLINGPAQQYKGNENKGFIDMVKRSRSLSSPGSLFLYRDPSWKNKVNAFKTMNPGMKLPLELIHEGRKLNRYARVAMITDASESILEQNDGTYSEQKLYDGATFVTPFTRIAQSSSTGGSYGRFVGPVMKNITHSFDVNNATKGFVKNAEYNITPWQLQNGSDWIVKQFEIMTSKSFDEPITVGSTEAMSALEVLKALGVVEDYSNLTDGHFTQAYDLMVEAGQQDKLIMEVIPKSSIKTGASAINSHLADDYITNDNFDLKYKSTQQDAMKDPNKGSDIKVLTQLVNTLSTNWVDSSVLTEFYNTLSMITNEYLDDFSKLTPEKQDNYILSMMKKNVLRGDELNYRTEAALAGGISINDRQFSGLHTQMISGHLRDNAVAYALKGGHYVIHPSTTPLHEVYDPTTATISSYLKSQMPVAPIPRGFTRLFYVGPSNPTGVVEKIKNVVSGPSHLFSKHPVQGLPITYMDVDTKLVNPNPDGTYSLPSNEGMTTPGAEDIIALNPRELKWTEPVRLSDGKTLAEMYDEFSVEEVHHALKWNEWSVGEAEILLPAEMQSEFMLGEALTNNIPIEQIGQEYFAKQLMRKEKTDVSKGRAQAVLAQSIAMEESFRLRLKGIIGRIPTSGKHSAVSTKIAGFFQGSMNSIQVPTELYKIQGADQDIDKGSYLTYKSIVRHRMKDMNSQASSPVWTYNPKNLAFQDYTSIEEKPTGIIPTDLNRLEEYFKTLNINSQNDKNAIRRITMENILVNNINKIMLSSKSVVEANTSTDRVLQPMRDVRDEEESTQTPYTQDDFLSYVRIHEANQAGGKNITGMFANGQKAYNVLYTMAKMNQGSQYKTFLAGLDEADNQVWAQYAGLVGATVDNANEGILGPMKFDNITGPYVAYLASQGYDTRAIRDLIRAEKPFFDYQRKLNDIDSPRAYNPKTDRTFASRPDLVALKYRTDEFNLLARWIVNRDIPVRQSDLASYIIQFERFVGESLGKNQSFDLVEFTQNPEYAQSMIDKYEKLIKGSAKGVDPLSKHTFNILRVFNEVPHIKSYLRAMIMSHQTSLKQKAYSTVFEIERNAKFDNYFYDSDSFSNALDTVYASFIANYLQAREWKGLTKLNLGEPEQRREYIDGINSNYDKLVSQNNEFVKNLILAPEKDKDGVSWQRLRLPDFYEMNEDKKALLMDEFKKLPDTMQHQLFLYNLIVTRDKNSKGSFTSLIPYEIKKDYNNFVDYELHPESAQIADVIEKAKVKSENIKKGVTYTQSTADYYIPFKTNFTQENHVQKRDKDFSGYPVYSLANTTLNNSRIAVTSKINDSTSKYEMFVNETAMRNNFKNPPYLKSQKLKDGSLLKPLFTKESNPFKTMTQYRNFALDLRLTYDNTVKKEGESDSAHLRRVYDIVLGKSDIEVVDNKSEKENEKDARNCGLTKSK